MIVYAESSAILSWILREPAERLMRPVLDGATRVVTSSLTEIECAHGLARARFTGRLAPTEELAGLRLLDDATRRWDVHELTGRVLSRARDKFPVEPVRTLDAFHLATAIVLRDAIGDLTILSLDERIVANARALGFPIAEVA